MKPRVFTVCAEQRVSALACLASLWVYPVLEAGLLVSGGAGFS